MNKKVVAIVAVLVVAILGGAAYYFFFYNYDEVEAAREAFKGDGEISCTFTDPNTNQEGEVYGSDGNIRMNIKGEPISIDASQSNDDEALNHILFLEDTAYAWSEGEDQGYEFPVSPEDGDSGALSSLDDKEKFANDYEENNYSCERGAEDGLFERPDDIEFVDFGQILNERSS